MSRFVLSFLPIEANYYLADSYIFRIDKSCTYREHLHPHVFKAHLFSDLTIFQQIPTLGCLSLLVMAIRYFFIYMVYLIKASSS